MDYCHRNNTAVVIYGGLLMSNMYEWADSKGHGLEEPPAWKIHKLIEHLQRDYEVRLKSNLERLL